MVTVKKAENPIFNTECSELMGLCCHRKMYGPFLGRVTSPWSCDYICSCCNCKGFGFSLLYQAACSVCNSKALDGAVPKSQKPFWLALPKGMLTWYRQENKNSSPSRVSQQRAEGGARSWRAEYPGLALPSFLCL